MYKARPTTTPVAKRPSAKKTPSACAEGVFFGKVSDLSHICCEIAGITFILALKTNAPNMINSNQEWKFIMNIIKNTLLSAALLAV
ncbi:hypothetical protein, partial [Paludibacterium sp.]|uniref:hypothetical protein n=1 Tax=Paludibacterium sp. TaxID=1917523 RepID=UPI0025F8E9B5